MKRILGYLKKLFSRRTDTDLSTKGGDEYYQIPTNCDKKLYNSLHYCISKFGDNNLFYVGEEVTVCLPTNKFPVSRCTGYVIGSGVIKRGLYNVTNGEGNKIEVLSFYEPRYVVLIDAKNFPKVGDKEPIVLDTFKDGISLKRLEEKERKLRETKENTALKDIYMYCKQGCMFSDDCQRSECIFYHYKEEDDDEME